MTATAELRTRDAFRHVYRHTTRADVAFALQVAETAHEVDAAAHLSLALFGVADSLAEFDEHDRSWPSLQVLTNQARHRVHGFPPMLRELAERMDAISANATARRRSDAAVVRAQRDAQIEQVGITNVQPDPAGGRR